MKYKFQLISVKNTKLEKDGIAAINMPPVLTCPGAGECKKYCYARIGPQSWPASMNMRMRCMNLFKDNPKEFERLAIEESLRSGRRIVRWHSSGDIMNLSYLKMMVRVARKLPEVKFYTYTKSISIVKKLGFKNLPKNLRIIQSYGGREDKLIDEKFPFARIYLNEESIPKGYDNCSQSDYLAATSAVRIAIIVHGNRKSFFKPQE